jgi:glycosyltransferase involved in cell wall biosynthesis
MIEIFTVVKDAEDIVEYYINHYRTAFPGCIINIYDNNSKDKTVEICKAYSCNVFNFPKYTEFLLQDFKNGVWKKSSADWVIVCDIDELLQITLEDLQVLDPECNAISTIGYNMISSSPTIDWSSLTQGSYSKMYSKSVMFKPQSIKNINYCIGAHMCNPSPKFVYSKKIFNLLHYSKNYLCIENYIRSIKEKNPLLPINYQYLYKELVIKEGVKTVK